MRAPRFGALAGCAEARRRRWPSRVAATGTSVSAAPRGRGTAGNCASPGMARGCGWSDGIVDNSGRTSLSCSSRTVPALSGGSRARQIYPCGPTRRMRAACERRRSGRRRAVTTCGPPSSSNVSRELRVRVSRWRRLGPPRSRMATDGLGSSVLGSTHPELPLSFDEIADTAPQHDNPAVRRSQHARVCPCRGERPFAESCRAVIGSFMELSESASNRVRTLRIAVVRDRRRGCRGRK